MFGTEIEALKDSYDKTKYCALFLLVIHNGCIYSSLFSQKESAEDREKTEDIFEECQLPRCTPRKRIQEQLESLCGVFCKKEINEKWITIHDKLFDMLCLHFGTTLQIPFIKFGDSSVILRQTQLESLGATSDPLADNMNNYVNSNTMFDEINVKTGHCTVLIREENEEQYFKRIIDELSNGKCYDIFNQKQMENYKYREKMIKYLVKSGQVQKLLTSMEKNKIVHMFCGIDGFCYKMICTPLHMSFKSGFTDLVEYLLDIVENTNSEMFSLLLIKACKAGYFSIVKTMLRKGTKINITNFTDKTYYCSQTALFAACSSNYYDIVELLMKSGTDLNGSIYCDTPLAEACANGNEKMFKLLLEYGACFDPDDGKPLIYACTSDSYSIVKHLLDLGVNVNVGFNSETPLLQACIHGSLKLVELLLERGADFEYSRPPLNVASANGRIDIVQFLLDTKTDLDVNKLAIDKYDKEKLESPLSVACQHNKLEVVKLLVKREADVHLGRPTPIIAACGYIDDIVLDACRKEIIELLVRNGADTNSILQKACECFEDCELLNFLFERSDIFCTRADGHSYLSLACRGGNIECVKMLIKRGLEVNPPNDSNTFPLLPIFEDLALISNCNRLRPYQIAKLLLDKGASINATDDKGRNVLIRACEQHQNEKTAQRIIALFLERGANLNTADLCGRTALAIACRRNNYTISECLLKEGANVNLERSVYSHTPLTAACVSSRYNQNTKLVKLLLEHKADVNLPGLFGYTPLIFACYSGDYELIKLLVQRGANVNPDTNGKLSIDQTKSYERNWMKFNLHDIDDRPSRYKEALGFCEYTIDNYKISKTTEMVASPLAIACKRGDPKIVDYLLDNGADVNASGQSEVFLWLNTLAANRYFDEDYRNLGIIQTPLLVACRYNHIDIVNILLKHGADVNLKDEYNFTSLDLVKQNGLQEIEHVLLKRVVGSPSTSLQTSVSRKRKDTLDMFTEPQEKRQRTHR